MFRGLGPLDFGYLPGPRLALLVDVHRHVGLDCPSGAYCTAHGRLVRPECRPLSACPKLRPPVYEHGVIGLRTAADSTVTHEAWWSGNHASSVLSLANRLAIVYDDGVALVDPDTLRQLGAVVLPSAPQNVDSAGVETKT